MGIAFPLVATNRDWATLRAHLYWIYHDKVADEWRQGSFPNVALGLILLINGSLIVDQPDNRVQAKAGDWIVPATDLYHQTFSADAEVLSIRYQARWLDGQSLYNPARSLMFKSAAFPTLEKAAWRLWRAANKVEARNPFILPSIEVSLERFSKVQIEFLRFLPILADTFSQLSLLPTRIGMCDERVLRALGWLQELPLSHRFCEAQLATYAGLGARQFVRLFEKETGVTPRQFVDRRRREACLHLLRDSPVPIKQIASELGFGNLSDFSAWFKDKNGVSPRQLRHEEWEQKKLRPFP